MGIGLSVALRFVAPNPEHPIPNPERAEMIALVDPPRVVKEQNEGVA